VTIFDQTKQGIPGPGTSSAGWCACARSSGLRVYGGGQDGVGRPWWWLGYWYTPEACTPIALRRPNEGRYGAPRSHVARKARTPRRSGRRRNTPCTATHQEEEGRKGSERRQGSKAIGQARGAPGSQCWSWCLRQGRDLPGRRAAGGDHGGRRRGMGCRMWWSLGHGAWVRETASYFEDELGV
jgi:hypothetical protein